jgi:hypothetical protein
LRKSRAIWSPTKMGAGRAESEALMAYPKLQTISYPVT